MHVDTRVRPSQMASIILVPDLTAGRMPRHSLEDGATLLTKVRQNRLIDTFTEVPSYSLMAELPDEAAEFSGLGFDDIFVGVTRGQPRYIFPLRVKVYPNLPDLSEAEHDMKFCENRFGSLICRPLGSHLCDLDTIVLFEFLMTADGMRVVEERHYGMVEPECVKPDGDET